MDSYISFCFRSCLSLDIFLADADHEQLSKVHVTLIAFETPKRPDGLDAFVSARRKSPLDIAKEVGSVYQVSTPGNTPRRKCTRQSSRPWRV